MRIIIAKDYEEMSKRAANMVAAQIILKPNSIVGLATGSTPLSMYKYLTRMYMEEVIDFGEITTFNLDEYVGLSKNNPNSYNYYMYENFFKNIDVKPENINIPRGMTENIEEECRSYESRIKEMGGVDIQVLGIGNNGHIGFNEPDVKFEATTHLVELDDETIRSNSRFFDSIEDVPRQAISMGIKTIMHAKKVVLLASGESKAEVVKKMIYGSITPEIPASILQLHHDATIILDEAAAKYIK